MPSGGRIWKAESRMEVWVALWGSVEYLKVPPSRILCFGREIITARRTTVDSARFCCAALFFKHHRKLSEPLNWWKSLLFFYKPISLKWRSPFYENAQKKKQAELFIQLRHIRVEKSTRQQKQRVRTIAGWTKKVNLNHFFSSSNSNIFFLDGRII